MLAHLRKERFPKGEYNKLNLKKIGPCKILRNFSANAYELEIPYDMRISHIFIVVELYPYKGNVVEALEDIQDHTTKRRQQIPTVKPMEIEKILGKRTTKRPKKKECFEYSVKWQEHMVEDSNWIIEYEIQLKGFDLANIEENLFVPREYDVGASHSNHSLV